MRTKELKHLKRMSAHGGATIYGENDFTINQLCKNTNEWIRNHRAIGTLKNEEDGVVPYPELEQGESVIEEMEMEESPDKPALQ